MAFHKRVSGWFGKNKIVLRDLSLWFVIAAIGGLATALMPSVDPANKLAVLINSGIIVLNVFVVYLAVVGAARNVFKPKAGFMGALRFVFRKDMMTTFVGVSLLGVLFMSLFPIASRGVIPISNNAVLVTALLCSWMVISFSMKKIYSIQFYEEVMSKKERDEYEAKLNAEPVKTEAKGMFLVDLNNRVKNGLNRVTKVDRPRTHKLIFPFIQSLFVLLAPSVLLSWSLFVFTTAVYTPFSAITGPVVMSLAAAVWATWHVKGGFTRVIGKRVGRVMESYQS
jgi:hypothetical protein